jgi:HEAT repeat protein
MHIMASGNRPRSGKAGFKVLVNPGDLGLFIGLAHTRPRLITSALTATALGLAAAWVVSAWIRGGGGGPMLNIAAIVALFIGLFLASYINTMLLGDLFFAGRWRERVLLKRAVDDSSVEEDIAAAKDYSLHFLLLNLGMILALLLSSELITGGFLRYYQGMGSAVALLRSDDPEDRVIGLGRISHALNSARWADPTLHAEVARLVNDPNPDVQTKAFSAASRLQVVDAAPSLLVHLRDPRAPARVRAEAATALGRLQHRDAALDLIALAADPAAPDDLRLGALHGMLFWADPTFGPTFLAPLRQCALIPGQRLTTEQVALLFYGLAKTQPKGASAVALDWLEGGPCAASSDEQCAAAEALRRLGDPEDIPRLKAAYDRAHPEARCEGQYWAFRDEATVSLVEPELTRAKLVKAVGNRKSFLVFGWLRAIHQDLSLPLKLRNVAGTYINSLDLLYQEDCPSHRRHLPQCRVE